MSAVTVREHPFLVPILFFVLLVTLVYSFCPASRATSIVPSRHAEYLSESIRLLAQARDHALEDYSRMHQLGTLSHTGRHDYQLFIGFLDSRIHSYCEELHSLSGTAAISALPCSYSLGIGEGESDIFVLPPTMSSTTGEQIAQLDQSLNAALGQFDDMLLKEQQSIATHIPRRKDNGSALTRSGPEGPGGEQPEKRGETSDRADSEQGAIVKDSSRKHGDEGEYSDDTRQAEDAENGTQKSGLESSSQTERLDTRDDDVVARQLREAAEKETDPEIKKKLWEEYRKYKQGARRQ